METDAIPSKQTTSKTGKILFGCFLIIVGLVLGYFFIYQKVEKMNLQQDISYSIKGMIMVPFCLVFGIYYIIFAPGGAGAWKDLTPKQKPWFLVAIAASILATAGLVFWFSGQLKNHGYDSLF